ncbi:unnamed protein product [Cyprideis torosa]|uniref:Membrane protein insertase YidC n=1 Tax=Cyprideis torosa TaxID=163714 RepID=A0A7R8ZJX1_9CRUS|nr:unnamed protein product [Cyprideis torosa]CAG0889461.1 unnamed protein product [Cyprideis torosa]
MDTYRAFLAVLLSFVILLGYQYFFVKPEPAQVKIEQEQDVVPPSSAAGSAAEPRDSGQQTVHSSPQEVNASFQKIDIADASTIEVDTDLYSAVFSEAGGTIESFVLKKYKESSALDSPGKQLIENPKEIGYPLSFSWGSGLPKSMLYKASTPEVEFLDGKGQLVLTATTETGLEVEKIFTFSQDKYLIDLAVRVSNKSGQTLQGNAQLHQINVPFESKHALNRFLFNGPSVYQNGQLQEFKAKEFADGPKAVQGSFDWVAYEGNYFICAIIPGDGGSDSFSMTGNDQMVATRLSGGIDTLGPGQDKTYSYTLYYGPKKVSLLKDIGYNLDRSIDFGWFDIIARPTLGLLNFFHNYFHNYGIAIICVTIVFKLLFWPITQKGLKSMKNMQKLQPKMVKIKEKYKDDPQQMNREVMNLYKTYRVNPLGGCLPMVLQIPVFFALYKVLLLGIELRHAPFMLWINDLSAPDRLWIGFDIPWLGGIPVLTLLMGASMFVQQKLSPTTADPTQARIMMFLPVVFTFMFVNFASGLVLYWFVNNLLSILQQQLINRGNVQKA